jgi:hypothetical protein
MHSVSTPELLVETMKNIAIQEKGEEAVNNAL